MVTRKPPCIPFASLTPGLIAFFSLSAWLGAERFPPLPEHQKTLSLFLSLFFDRVMHSRVTPTAHVPSAPPTVVEGLEKSATT